MAEPVSTCVQLILEFLPRQAPRLGHEVINSAVAIFVARIPVLERRILDLGVVQSDELDHRRVKLVGPADGSGASLQVADIAALVRDDESPLELAGIQRVDAEIGHKLNRAPDAGRHVAERAVAEDRGVQRGVEVVGVWHYGTEIFSHQVWIPLHRLGDGTEDDARILEHLLVGRRDRNAVQHRVNRDAAQLLLLFQRNP